MSDINKVNLNGVEYPINVVNSKIVEFTWTYDEFTVSANDYHYYTPTNTLPSNYIPLGINVFNSGNVNLTLGAVVGNNGTIEVFNESSASVTATPACKIKCLVS